MYLPATYQNFQKLQHTMFLFMLASFEFEMGGKEFGMGGKEFGMGGKEFGMGGKTFMPVNSRSESKPAKKSGICEALLQLLLQRCSNCASFERR